MGLFSGGFVLGCLFSLLVGGATLGVCVWAAATEVEGDFDTTGD